MIIASQYYRRRMEEHDLIFKQLAQNIINPSTFHSSLGKRSRDGVLLRNGIQTLKIYKPETNI